MDSIMFSPYGYGPLPPSAMAEIEKKTASLRGGVHRMLEPEIKPKMEKRESDPVSPPSPPPLLSEPSNGDSLQARRAEKISQQQTYLMLKTAQRNILLPPLSIAIPLPARGEKRDPPREADTETETEKGGENSVRDEAGTTVEPLHKQVKFLAPDEGEMSDQSSICQSPSWEGYGRRKKEKKKEAERRKKEKEQAEKEARAAKKRAATRLSKLPPPETNGRTSRVGGLTIADRSMSDPLLINQYLLAENQPRNQPRDVERTVSADDLQRLQPYQPAMAEIISDQTSHTRKFVGGIKLDREREVVLQSHLASHGQLSPSFSHQSVRDDRTDGQQYPRSPPSDGSIPASHPSSQPLPARQEGRLPREVFPPSASRTPMLRQMPTPAHHRSNSLLQGASRIFRVRDGKNSGDTEAERGRYGDGYAQHHRDHSADHSLAEVAYEQLVNNGSLNSSSTRSSSRHTQHTRRSSFTQEARSVALKLAGIRATPTAKEDPNGFKRASIHNDYFNYPDHSSSGTGHGAGAPSEAGPASESIRPGEHAAASEDLSGGPHPPQDAPGLYERPATAQSSVSSNNPFIADSVPSNQSKKSRGLRDAAKAALSISRGGPQSPTFPKPFAMDPPSSTFRSRVEPQTSSPGERAAPLGPPMAVPAPPPTANGSEGAQGALTQTPSPSPPKPVAVDTHVGSRVSEGSSSSSAYEDGSPLPSPVTTPDTSRPQSSKDLPFIAQEITKHAAELPTTQDDEVTLRQSSEDSSTSSTPRLAKSETRESVEMTDEDRWSRTAMPIEIDTDTQSFTTSFSHLDHLDNIDETLADAQKSQTSPASHRSDRPDLSRENSGVVALPATPPMSEMSSDTSTEPMIKIPPRSKKRDLVANRSPTSPGETAPPGGSCPGLSTGQERPELSDKLLQCENAPSAGPIKQETPAVSRTHESGGRASQPPEEQVVDAEKRSMKREKTKKRHQPKQSVAGDVVQIVQPEAAEQGGDTAATEGTSVPLNRSTTSNTPSASSTKPLVSGQGVEAYLDVAAGNPYLEDFPGTTKTQYAPARGPTQVRTTPSSPESPRFPRTASPSFEPVARAALPPRMTSAPTPLLRPSSATSLPASVPSHNPSVSRPPLVSILKQPPARSTSDPAQPTSSGATRTPVLSALPKHMQLHAGVSTRPQTATAEARMAPIAKMFVECCNCKFYHDMPSKLYECMAKPDAVVEDRLLGISGAITTMVKCPWCQHNMTTNCCAGYAAVVYLKEKLH